MLSANAILFMFVSVAAVGCLYLLIFGPFFSFDGAELDDGQFSHLHKTPVQKSIATCPSVLTEDGTEAHEWIADVDYPERGKAVISFARRGKWLQEK